MHRKPSLLAKMTGTLAEHIAQKGENSRGNSRARIACEMAAWGLFSTAAGMVALPLGLAVGGVAFFAFSIQLRSS